MLLNKQTGKKIGGRFCAGIASLFVILGLGMLAAQGFTGEWMFSVTINGQRQPGEKPLGFEFASVFLAFGLAFFFIGLGIAASSPRWRLPLLGMGFANIVACVAAFGACFLSATSGSDYGWLLAIVWPLLLLAGVAIATRHPDYLHGAGAGASFAPGARKDPYARVCATRALAIPPPRWSQPLRLRPTSLPIAPRRPPTTAQ